MKLKKEQAIEIANLMRQSLKIQNEIEFGDFVGKAPDIDFYPDYNLYYDPNRYEIHLGIYGIVDIFNVETEEEFVNAVNYGRGHEAQHRRSTATTPYQWGIERGVEMILEYISFKEEKSKRRFRSAKDYKDFADRVLPSMDIFISYQLLYQIIGGIANSIEDGRIERIRSNRFPGFEKLRIYHRGKFWTTQKREYRTYEDIKNSPPDILMAITDQILSLATCQLYSGGFVTTYANTPVMDIVKDLMPNISRGIMAGRTRDMAVEVIEIAKKLAPYIYETCKLSKEDIRARTVLEKLLADMIKGMLDQTSNTGLTENEEDTDTGSANSTFPTSDLEITVDDETYDKLVEKSKQSDDGSGLIIKREHPKEQSEDGSDKESNENSNDKSRDSKENPSGTSAAKDGKNPDNSGKSMPGEPERGKKERAKDESKDGTEKKDGNQQDKGAEDPQKSNPSDKGIKKGEKIHGKNTEQGYDKDGVLQREKAGFLIEGENTAEEEMRIDEIKKAMLEAAESTNELARKQIDNINRAEAHARKTVGPVVQNNDPVVTAEDVKGICPDFKEMKRVYKLKDKLPPVLAAMGRTLYRKNKRYFKSLSTPNVSFLDSGSVDPSRIYGLSFGDTDIFRKKGIDKKFDGCVYILIDNSGSMSGAKRVEACKAAALIEESFRGLIPIKIVAFDWQGQVIHEVVKGWNEQQNLNCCWNFCLYGRQGGGNADGYDILVAQKELLARPERKKLLIVLSDGMPAEASPGFTKGAIDETRKKGIQVSGIYFEEGDVIHGSEQFKAMYGNKDAIACPLSELSSNLEKIAKKFSRS